MLYSAYFVKGVLFTKYTPLTLKALDGRISYMVVGQGWLSTPGRLPSWWFPTPNHWPIAPIGAAPTRDVEMLCNMCIYIYIWVSVKMINPPKMDIFIILILNPNFDGFTWVQFDFEWLNSTQFCGSTTGGLSTPPPWAHSPFDRKPWPRSHTPWHWQGNPSKQTKSREAKKFSCWPGDMKRTGWRVLHFYTRPPRCWYIIHSA